MSSGRLRSPSGCMALLVLCGVPCACSYEPSAIRVYQLAEMNTNQIRALDRERTVILIPGGIMEEHGPYLPSYSDGYQEEGLPMHAGLLETSRVMAVRRDLVPSTVSQPASITPRLAPDAFRIAAGSDWPGYLGAPRYATPEIGRRVFEGDTGWLVSTAFRLLDGQADERTIPRIAASMQNPDVARALERSQQRDAAMAKRQQAWIAAQ